MWQSDIEDELKDPAEGSEAYWKRQAAIARLALAAIERWQRAEALKRTWLRRPDLLEKADLSDEDKKILEKIRLHEI
jgi:hypothetical protein